MYVNEDVKARLTFFTFICSGLNIFKSILHWYVQELFYKNIQHKYMHIIHSMHCKYSRYKQNFLFKWLVFVQEQNLIFPFSNLFHVSAYHHQKPRWNKTLIAVNNSNRTQIKWMMYYNHDMHRTDVDEYDITTEEQTSIMQGLIQGIQRSKRVRRAMALYKIVDCFFKNLAKIDTKWLLALVSH